MLEADVPIYLELHRFLTRNAEVAREKPGKDDFAGNLPLDKAFPTLQMDAQIIYHLAPLPGTAFNPSRTKGTGKDKKRFSQDSEVPDRKKGKGKGIPTPLQESGLKHECSKTGARICWNYNLKDRGCKFAKAGEQCKRGLHLCMRCEQLHPLFDCKAKAGG